jgi:hypothetical protein
MGEPAGSLEIYEIGLCDHNVNTRLQSYFSLLTSLAGRRETPVCQKGA